MKFNIKTPCENCPFRTDRPLQKGWLGYNRAKEIAEVVLVGNATFTCHKTLHSPKEAMCAGALSMLHRASKQASPFGNQMVQIAERLGLYDPSQQNHEVPVFSTSEEMAKFHENSYDSESV